MDTPLLDAMAEAKERLQEFSNTSYQNAENALARYAYLVRTGSILGLALDNRLPSVDFDSWYASALATQGGMVGSAHLTWPMETADIVAIQLCLVRKLVTDIDLMGFVTTFTYGGTRFDESLGEFFRSVLVPFHNGVLRVLKDALQAEEGLAKEEEARQSRSLPFPFHPPRPTRRDFRPPQWSF